METKRTELGSGKVNVYYISIQYKIIVSRITVGRKKKKKKVALIVWHLIS